MVRGLPQFDSRRFQLHQRSFRRVAQYFFIRWDTALLAAGDILRRRAFGAGATNSFAAARSARPPLEAIARVSRRRVARSGNVLSRSASSACSSFQRDSAPRRASARIEDECLAMANDNTRMLWRVQSGPVSAGGRRGCAFTLATSSLGRIRARAFCDFANYVSCRSGA